MQRYDAFDNRPAERRRERNGAIYAQPKTLTGISVHETELPAWEQSYESPCLVLRGFDRRGAANCIVLDRAALSRGTMLLGGVGQGKSNVMHEAFRQLLGQMQVSKGDSMVVFDTKADYEAIGYREENPRHFIIGAPERHPSAARWNLFLELGELNSLGHPNNLPFVTEKLQSIAKALFAGRESTSQPFFALAAQNLFTLGCLYMIREARRTGTSARLCNAELRRFFLSLDAEGWKTVLGRYEDSRSALAYFAGTKGDTGASVLATLNSMIMDLFTVRVFGAGEADNASFSVRDIVCNGGVLYIEYDMMFGSVYAPMYRVLIEQCINTRCSLGGRTNGELYLMLDEFALLPKVDASLTTAVNFGRDLGNGHGIKVLAGLQNIHQVEEYAAEGKSILGGFTNVIAFNIPCAESRQYISTRLGKRMEIIITDSSAATRQSVPYQTFAADDETLCALQRGQAVVKISGFDPFLFTFGKYD